MGRAPVRIGVSIPREIHYYFDQLLAGITGFASLARQVAGDNADWALHQR